MDPKYIELIDTPKELFQALHESWLNLEAKDEKAGGKALAQIHNDGHGCVFALALEAIPTLDNSYKIIRPLQEALPLLNSLDTEKVIDFERSMHKRQQTDGFGGTLSYEYAKRFSSHPNEAREIIDKHLATPSQETSELFRAALVGLGTCSFKESFDISLESSFKDSPHVSAYAVRALGFLDWRQKENSAELETALDRLWHILNDKNESLYPDAACTLQEIVNQRPELHDHLIRLGKSGTIESLSAVVNFVLRNHREHHLEEWFKDLVQLGVRLHVHERQLLDQLDLVLPLYVKDDDQSFILQWLEDWIINQPNEAFPIDLPKVFNSTFMKLTNTQSGLKVIFTKWLIHDDHKFSSMTNGIATWLYLAKVKDYSFDAGVVRSLDDPGIMQLVRRMLGWVVHTSLRLSLVWSLIDACGDKDKGIQYVYSLFHELFVYDYPGAGREFIARMKEESSADKEIVKLCDNILAEINSYADSLDAAMKIKEFKPQWDQIVIFGKARHKEQAEMMEEASKNSIIRQIAHQIPVKCGSGSFYKNNDGSYSERSPFASFKQEETLPVTDLIDKVGSERQLEFFRFCKRGDR